jgi:A/G-specific adenine glycosylase
MAALRDAPGAVRAGRLDAVWADAEQRDRALAGLVADGLVERDEDSLWLAGDRG